MCQCVRDYMCVCEWVYDDVLSFYTILFRVTMEHCTIVRLYYACVCSLSAKSNGIVLLLTFTLTTLLDLFSQTVSVPKHHTLLYEDMSMCVKVFLYILTWSIYSFEFLSIFPCNFQANFPSVKIVFWHSFLCI